MNLMLIIQWFQEYYFIKILSLIFGHAISIEFSYMILNDTDEKRTLHEKQNISIQNRKCVMQEATITDEPDKHKKHHHLHVQ